MMNNDLTITITRHNAMVMHNLLERESRKYDCEDDWSASQFRELSDIDKALGYEGFVNR